MSIEGEELHRMISASVRDMLDAFRIQAAAGPVTDKALEEITFRAAHGVVGSLTPYPGSQRVASLVRMLLATFLEELASVGGPPDAPREGRAYELRSTPSVGSPPLRRPAATSNSRPRQATGQTPVRDRTN